MNEVLPERTQLKSTLRKINTSEHGRKLLFWFLQNSLLSSTFFVARERIST